MSLHEQATRRPKRAKTTKTIAKTIAVIPPRRRRQAEQVAKPFERVIPLQDWANSKSISLTTAKRLRSAGKLKTVQLSANRIGVTESADREYMAGLESA